MAVLRGAREIARLVEPASLQPPARLAGGAALRTQSDHRLVELARAGSEPAFEAIVERYRGPLRRYCRRMIPQSRVDDVVQRTFLSALSRELGVSVGGVRQLLNRAPNSLRATAAAVVPLPFLLSLGANQHSPGMVARIGGAGHGGGGWGVGDDAGAGRSPGRSGRGVRGRGATEEQAAGHGRTGPGAVPGDDEDDVRPVEPGPPSDHDDGPDDAGDGSGPAAPASGADDWGEGGDDPGEVPAPAGMHAPDSDDGPDDDDAARGED